MNKKQELLEDINDVILECLEEEWCNALDHADFQTTRDYEAYGDTYVSSGDYITEESENCFREGFKQDMTPDEFIERLVIYPGFKEYIGKLIKEHADTADLVR